MINKQLLNIGMLSLVFFCQGQAQTRPLKDLPLAAYKQWSALGQTQISPNGDWISYVLYYEANQDTLVIKNSHEKIEYAFPKAYQTQFSSNNKYCNIYQSDGCTVLDLKNGSKTFFAQITDCKWMGNEKYLLLFDPQEKNIRLHKQSEVKSYILSEIAAYAISPNHNRLAYIDKAGAVHVVDMLPKISIKTVLKSSKQLRKNLVWKENSTAIALLEEKQIPSDHKVYLIEYIDKKTKTSILNDSTTTVGYTPAFTPLYIGPDTSGVFFYTPFQSSQYSKSAVVEVWDSRTPMEYGRTQLEGNGAERPHLQVWKPQSGVVIPISNDTLHKAYVTPDRKKALVFDPHKYEPQREMLGPTDYWLKDLAENTTTLILKKQPQNSQTLGMAPNGQYFNYYRENKWWVYDIAKKEHRVISDRIPTDPTDKSDGDTATPSYGYAGWTKDSKNVLVYTEYDVWLLSVEGKPVLRLTNGTKTRTQYRIANTKGETEIMSSFDTHTPVLNLKEGLILQSVSTNSKASGYHKWDPIKGLSNLIVKQAALSDLKKASNAAGCILTEQRVDLSPRILSVNEKEEVQVVTSTNLQQHKYYWTKNTSIHYTNRSGVPLQGILHYPTNYQKEKVYPMVVYIYEKQSKYLHRYTNPSLYNADGFNATHYTVDGYFVLYPDIEYELGNPGFSALDCVEAAVAAVQKELPKGTGPIGLIGHSFGGYETSFISTQTTLFAAAVAGAACTDLVGHSLTLDVAGRSQMWRYQSYQMRMNASLFEDYKGFFANSVIPHLQRITTPLLSWTGTNDRSVDPQQSKALHMAMRSLGKKHILLLYKDQPHTLVNPEAQKDATLKTKAWMDYYLKSIPFSVESGLK